MTGSFRRQRIAELGVLLLVLAACGVAVVPCHSTSIWADAEFTGWVVPIADRLALGQKLYAPGGHIPLPPFSFVLARLMFGAHGRWIHESALNYCAQAGAILAIWAGLAWVLRGPIPFATALGTLPLFLHLAKSIAYDSLTQLGVALIGSIVVVVVMRSDDDVPLRWIFALGIVTAVCILTKQNTGAGAAMGTGIALVAMPATVSLRTRLWRTGSYALAMTLALAVATYAMRPFIDLQGLWLDVVLTGSEPKGGTAALVAHLGDFTREIVTRPPPVWLIICVGVALLGFMRREESQAGPGVVLAPMVAGVLGAVIGLLMAWRIPESAWAAPEHVLQQLIQGQSVLFGGGPASVLQAGLTLSAALVCLGALRASWLVREPALQVATALTMVTLPAALFHNLSVGVLRWDYDNNPLLASVLVVWGALAIMATRLLGSRVARATVLTIVAGLLQLGLWSSTLGVVSRITSCTESWPEVPYLTGARLTKHASGMRAVVRDVFTFAPNPNDEVLLLPSDPNVEAWFARPRPLLSTAIIFPDQYWQRYVHRDLMRLRSKLPAVIVIGPRNYWEFFGSTAWSSAAKTLTDGVRAQILPQFYKKVAKERITGRVFGSDIMDIYQRVLPPVGPAAGSQPKEQDAETRSR